jgi:EmrB/QacA subfamily drug resistance transporter
VQPPPAEATTVRAPREPSQESLSLQDKRRIGLLFAGLMVGLLLSELDQTIFATALPTVVGELEGVDQMLWVTTAYALAGTVTMPIYGKLGDLVGRKSLFLVALGIFVLGSVIGGLSTDMTGLIVGRTVQGLGGGGLLILIQAIVADIIPARQRAPYMSVIGAVFALSAVLGPFLGGWFAEGIGWRWALWINVPLGGVSILLAAALLRVPNHRVQRVHVDVWGITTMTAAVTSLVLLSTWGGTRYAWTSPVITCIGAVAVLAAIGFVMAEQRAVEPLIPLRLFRMRNFTLATTAGLIMAVAMFGTIGYLPTYLQMVNGLGATGSGLVMLALIGGVMTTTLLAAQVVSRTGRYKWLPVIGAAVVALALALLSTIEVQTDLRVVGGYLFLLGAGIGCALEILVIIVQNTVPAADVGTATAATSFFREIGVSLGSAVVGTLFTSRLTALLAERLPGEATSAGEAVSLVPARVQALPEALRAPIVAAYHDALTPVFVTLVPLLLLSVVGLWFIKPVPLATTVPRDESPGGGAARTDPASDPPASEEAAVGTDRQTVAGVTR